ncbi:MAG: hypothetical protein LQ352_004859 [Teloschistes flavicans]|nr:MAG: hypothetical protein LQ352_004859 [Teloschistes flavicans]
MSEKTLSKRGQKGVPAGEAFGKLVEMFAQIYDQESNPDGIPSISLGVAENGLMHEELVSFFNKIDIAPKHLTYGDGPFGSRALRSALASFFNDYFHPLQKVLPEQLLVASGCTSVLDLVSFGIADEGDGILIGRPLYTGFASDLNSRSGAIVCPVSSEGQDPMSEQMVQQYEKELLKQEKQGTKIRAIILASPHNPLGKCYSVETLKAYMRLCQRHRIHLISDEIYAMTIYQTPHNASALPFTSVLAIDTADLIDPSLLHVVYGMSKDFSGNGLRCGVLLSPANPSLLKSLKSIALFAWPASVADLYWTALLNDRAFLDYYFAENSRKLGEGYMLVTDFLRKEGVGWVEGSSAGFFLWADFRALLGDAIVVRDEGEGGKGKEGVEEEVEAMTIERPSQVYKTSKRAKERDDWFYGKLMEKKVYVASGDAFFAEEHGWYRISFSVPKEVLDIGLRRLGEVLGEVRAEAGGKRE